MRYPCSEKELLDALKEKLEKESGVPARYFDHCIWHWKQECHVKLSGSRKQVSISPVKLSDFEKNEKLPKDIFRRFPENEQVMRVELEKCSARVDYILNEYVSLKVTGSFTGKKREESVTLIVMVYNGDDELAGYEEAGFDILYDGEENIFDVSVGLPADEWISAIEVRFTRESPLIAF